MSGQRWEDWGPRAEERPCLPSPLQPQPSAPLQNLTTDLTAVRGVLQSRQARLQQGERATGSGRLHNLYWQAMKTLGVQYVWGGGHSLGKAGETLGLHVLGYGSFGQLGSHRTLEVAVTPALTGRFLNFAHFLPGAPSQRRRMSRKSPVPRRAPLA